MEPLEQHVSELKQRLKASALLFVADVGIVFYYSGEILRWLQADLSVSLYALQAYEAIYTQIMISLLGGFFLALPFLLYQLIKFMKPGLKPKEYKLLRNYLPFSLILFVTGFAFAYRFVVRASLKFFMSMNQSANVSAVWGLKSTIGLVLKLSAFTGVIFQLPIVSIVLAKAGLIDSSMMKQYRAYFLVAVLAVAAVATPPDIFTQLLVTVPVLGLYQLSIWLVKVVES